MSRFPEYTHEKSRAWFDRALNVIPSGIYGHLGPSEGLFLPLEKWPLISSRAEGTYFWDMDGNRYIDMMCAYGPNVLGYNDPDVDAAALEQPYRGSLPSRSGFASAVVPQSVMTMPSNPHSSRSTFVSRSTEFAAWIPLIIL